MKDTVLMAALAGLLHDIGKFAQRAGEQVSAEWSDGKTRHDFGYQHALHTWHFVNKYLPDAFKQAGVMAAFHHRPNEAGKIIQIADHLSASERNPEAETDDSDRKKHPRQMLSIFSSLSGRRNEPYLPLAALRLDKKAIFPNKTATPDDSIWKTYELLWREFCSEAETLKTAHTAQPDLEAYLEAMLALMQRYAWSIPSAYYKARPDVSLYDHSRMTAALAAILSQREPGNVEKKALLVGGDISGVQDFIYTIASKGAAKTLRGRSFYLQLLTESALRFVLRRLELPYTNVIYSGGGNFFLLAAPSARDKLPEIRAELSHILLHQHGTALYLALGCAEVPEDGFQPGKLPQSWDAMHAAVNQAKQQRYAELGAEAYEKVFSPAKFGGNPDKTCSICGNDQLETQKFSDVEGQKRICTFCESFQQIGEELPHSKFLALGWVEPSPQPADTAQNALAELGLTYQLLDENEPVTLTAKRMALWALEDVKNGKWPPSKVPVAHFLRYAANKTPIVTSEAEAREINARLSESDRQEDPAICGRAKSLTHLQAQTSGGFEYLGVIRLDVDNVGEIFKHGLGDLATLSRIAALSSQMSLFFEGWLKQICEQPERRERIYTVYSGGDDAFLLGPWDLMPALAQEIAREFAEYTGNPKITLSAGMSFIGGKYPIYQAAEDAHKALEKAKDLPGKNAFNFLGESWSWDKFNLVEAKCARVIRIVTELNGPRAIIQVLRELAEQKSKKQKTSQQEVWGPWQWRGAYLLKRMEERASNNKELAAAVKTIREELDNDNYSELNQWGAAARWAQLKTRKSVKED